MKTHVVTVSPDGVVVLPEEIRERLGGGYPQSVAFVTRDDGSIEVRPAPSALEGVFGPVPSLAVEQPMDREVAIGYFMWLSNSESYKKLLGR